jgi:opacity protein-like surface antigen
MTKVLIILAASLAACVSTATAGDWYTGVYGGMNQNSVIAAPFVKEKTGSVFGAVLGKNITAIPGLRIEADLSFRTNEVDIFGGAITADHETTGALFNVAYDFGAGPVKPYLLAGVGYAHTQATFENVSLLRLEASDIAFQLGAGVQVPLFPGARLGVGYRFFQGPTIEVLGTELSDGQNHSAIGSLSFDF